MTMLDTYALIKGLIDKERLYSNTERLMRKELPQTFKAYHEAAAESVKIMREMDFDEVALIEFPADGKTVYMDKCMPIAWDASIGKLTVKKSSVYFPDPVVADYQRHPFSLVRGSVSTPPGGMDVRVITEMQMYGGADPKGCLVMCEATTPPRPAILKVALDLGALGIISDFSKGGTEYPDSIQWVTACTEGSQWHVQGDDRDFISFSVSRRIGDMLREAANAGELTAHIECNGKRYEGKLPAVEAIISGKSEKEIWLLAHLHEPLADDNSLGVASAIEIAHALKKLAGNEKPEFTVRVVLATEMYGFAAYAAKNMDTIKEKVTFALNFDGLPHTLGENLTFHVCGNPCFADYFAREFVSKLNDKMPFKSELNERGAYFDDMFLGDKSVGLPTLWPITKAAGFHPSLWHNSTQTMEVIDKNFIHETISGLGAFITSCADSGKDTEKTLNDFILCAMENINAEVKKLAENIHRAEADTSDIDFAMKKRFEREKIRFEHFKKAVPAANTETSLRKLVSFIESGKKFLLELLKETGKEPEKKSNKLLEYADSIIPERAEVGFPYDLKKVSKTERRDIPDNSIYGPFTRIMSNMNGKKTLKDLILEAQWESGEDLSKRISKYINAVKYLTDCGYFKTKFSSLISKDKIMTSLKNLGLKKGDTVMLHSGLSQLGLVDGGAETVINAFIETLGEGGTLLMPSFTRPYTAFEGIVKKNANYRPYDPSDASQISVGAIPQAFFRRKGVIRNNHPTHSVIGLGANAEKCLFSQQENDSPAGERSAFAFLPGLNAKIVWFGADLSTSTYLHYIEDKADLPYLKSAFITIKTEDGLRRMFYPKHLPGCRDFYSKNAEKTTKIYRKMLTLGLEIKKVPLGLGEVKALDAVQAYELAEKAVNEDPEIMLCDKPECFFCQKFKTRK